MYRSACIVAIGLACSLVIMSNAYKVTIYGGTDFGSNYPLCIVLPPVLLKTVFTFRILWLAVVTIAVLVFVGQVATRVVVYFQYKSNVAVTVNYVNQIDFPTVTICNQNNYRYFDIYFIEKSRNRLWSKHEREWFICCQVPMPVVGHYI